MCKYDKDPIYILSQLEKPTPIVQAKSPHPKRITLEEQNRTHLTANQWNFSRLKFNKNCFILLNFVTLKGKAPPPPPKNSKSLSFNTHRAKHQARTTKDHKQRRGTPPAREECETLVPKNAREKFLARFC